MYGPHGLNIHEDGAVKWSFELRTSGGTRLRVCVPIPVLVPGIPPNLVYVNEGNSVSVVYNDLVLGINHTENHATNELVTFTLYRIKYWCHV